MELILLKVLNFKVFKGEHTFDLETKKGKPIVLIGGDNGSGKSSLFEALQIAFYGR